MENKLTQIQAFKVMLTFLDEYYDKTLSDDIGALLSGLALLEDDRPVDSAVWHDWAKAINNKNIENNLTSLQAFEAMINFLEDYCKRGSSHDVLILLDMLKKSLIKSAPNQPIWNNWLKCVDKILQDKEKKYGYFHLLK